MQEWMSCLWQRPKMDNYEKTSGGGQPSEGRYSLKSSPSPSSPSLPAARHNPGSGSDRLTNRVNKYFPPLLKANQILILGVWSAEIKNNKQLVEGNWLDWFFLSLNTWGCVQEEEEEEGRMTEDEWWNCRNSFQNENRQIFGYARLKQFQFLIQLLQFFNPSPSRGVGHNVFINTRHTQISLQLYSLWRLTAITHYPDPYPHPDQPN